MKQLFVYFILFLSMAVHAEPFENWTDKEKILYGTASLAMIADFKSTSSVLYPDQGYKEANPFLGEQPSKDKLTLWFVGLIVGHYFIANSLSHEYRTQYLLTVTGVHGAAAHNVSIGATIRF